MNFRNVTVAGTGVLGSQIAYQTAYKGLLVRVYDISDDVLVHARERFIKLKENYREDLDLTQQTVDEAFNRISLHRHVAGKQQPYTFSTPEQLIEDFLADVRRLRGE